jgi:hypothetical protein
MNATTDGIVRGSIFYAVFAKVMYRGSLGEIEQLQWRIDRVGAMSELQDSCNGKSVMS